MIKLARSPDNVHHLLSILGFKPNGQIEKQVYLVTAYLLAWLINGIFGLLHEWNNFTMRLSVLNDLTLALCTLLYWHFMGDMHVLFGIIKRNREKLQSRSIFDNINRRFLENLDKLDDYVENTVRLYVILHFVFISVPISSLIYKVATSEEEIDYKRMPQIWYFYYPASLERVTFLHYCCGNLLIYLGFFMAIFFSFILIYAIFIAIYSIINYFDYLILCMLDWDRLSTDINTKLNSDNANSSTLKFYELQLRYGLYEIIVFHQHLCRETSAINKGIQRNVLIFMNICAIQMCLAYFSLTEGEEKLKYLIYATFVLIYLTCFCGFGQLVKNKVDILRVTLAQFRWVDKPAYYKKSLLIMITYAARDMEINPYGLHPLDMQTFTKVMKLLYSISNIVSHYKARV